MSRKSYVPDRGDFVWVSIWQGKGRVDRQVKLPTSYDALLRALASEAKPDAFVFPGEREGRHISPRTIPRVVKRAVRLARIGKVVRENRPGWLEFSLPAEESWRDSLCELTAPQRERIDSAAFYELLQREIGKGFLALRPG